MDKVKTRSAKRISEIKSVAAKAVKALSAGAVGKKKKISDEEFNRRVQHKAYEVYVNSGYIGGKDQENWLEAERLVKAELGM